MDWSGQVRQIIFDADDTLWENNIYYVQASGDFFDLAVQAGLDRQQAEKDFDALELQVVRERGYGSHNFVYILEELFRRYAKAGYRLDEQRFAYIVRRFKDHPEHPPKLFDGVIETLRYLKEKYDLYILTKGEFDEQEGKILRAKVNHCVKNYFILPEKNDQAYQKLMAENGWRAEETCMVGNSPKSDINPALRCGMYAIHIPYRDTWKLDDEPLLDAPGRLLVLKKFTDLKTIF